MDAEDTGSDTYFVIDTYISSSSICGDFLRAKSQEKHQEDTQKGLLLSQSRHGSSQTRLVLLDLSCR